MSGVLFRKTDLVRCAHVHTLYSVYWESRHCEVCRYWGSGPLSFMHINLLRGIEPALLLTHYGCFGITRGS